MKKRWVRPVLLAVALIAFACSTPLYFLAVMGVGMSPGKPHLGLPLACLLWTPPVLCISSSVSALTIQRPARAWCWLLAVPLSLLSVLEAVWTLLILLEG
jgi:hypothetical protein